MSQPDFDRVLHQVADLAARLRRACAHLSDEQYAELVFDLASTWIRFDRIDASIAGRATLRASATRAAPLASALASFADRSPATEPPFEGEGDSHAPPPA